MPLPPRARYRLSLRACLLGPVLALACSVRGLDPSAGDAEVTSTGAPDPTTAAPDPTTGLLDPTTAAPDPTTTGAGDTAADSSAGFADDPGDPDSGLCDAWLQDCPEGQKCMPVSLDGDPSPDETRCVPLVVDPDGLNQPCAEIGAPLDGLDSCAEGLMCWSVDEATQTGVCHGLCTGTPDEPACADPEAVCIITSAGVLNLCLPTCDPLAQDCPAGEACIYNASDGGQTFVCTLDGSGDEGQVFDVCEYVNACEPGLLCLNPGLAVECDAQGSGCCLPACDLDVQPDLCPGEGQECLPWYEEGAAPPGSEDIGLCALP